uniref:NADH-ubiquinone oxidoreductase chain 6 n=1 Tax=Liogluta microptera TaxID=866049 RepID=A0A0S2M7J7_LIOMI|nr:NADH dehydrogenase subunit 6 [Liogluta microptera]ALO70662.1 NADH deshydrogenase subunit 6 [Liogluta microptera]
MLMMLNFCFSMIFTLLNHPMTMGLILLIQTIIISMITGMLNTNFWFSYILFLIMIGGMLVLFIYMTSIASNEMFNYSNKTMITLFIITFTFMFIYILMDNFLLNINFLYLENYFNISSNSNSLMKYFNYPSMMMIFFMIIYLFITLVAVVKITKIEFGPLRQLF